MNKANRGRAKTYDSDTLMFRSVMGVLLIALGVITGISVVGGIQGVAFTQIKYALQGFGGSVCLGIPVILIWGGGLVAFSAHRKAPVRAYLFLVACYLFALGIINLLSMVITTPLMEYTVAYNRAVTPPMTNPDGFWNVIATGYKLCGDTGDCGGALGMLTAWPLFTFIGTTGGVAILGLLSLICVLFFTKFDFIGAIKRYREGGDERLVQHELEKQRKAQAKQTKQNQPEAAETGKERPARLNRQRQPEQQPYAGANREFAPEGMAQPAFGYAGVGYPAANIPLNPMQGIPMQQTMFSNNLDDKPAELYDEMIVPEMPSGTKPSAWKLRAGSGKREPRELKTPEPMPDVQAAALARDREAAKVLERMEENRRRKEEIERKIRGQGNDTLQYPDTLPGKARPVENKAVDVPQNTFAPAQRAEPVPARPILKTTEVSSPVWAAPPQAPEEYEPPMTAAQIAFANQAATYQPPHAPEAPRAAMAASAPPERFDAYKKPTNVQPMGQPIVKLPKQNANDSGKPLAKVKKPYPYPMIELLNLRTQSIPDTRDIDRTNATKLEQTLESFGIPARVQRVTHGPAVTRFELGLVSSGINVKRIMNIADNIALDMAANGGVRIEVPIPGTNLFGVEIPNKEIISVSLADVLTSPEMTNAKSPLSVALGKDIAGRPVICDLAKMPHLLIAGQTGSGKSVCINAIINSLLYRATPDEVRMIMIDPKVVELQGYNKVPHLLIPVVSDPHKAAGALSWAVQEMLDRYHKMQSKGVREITAYNAKVVDDEPKLPRIVIIIDELSDLMLACKKEVEESIIRLAQLARAAGIHVVVATQRPTVNVITGLIKANIPSRISFAVASSIDSRTILDMNGAEKLLGKGDMFYYPTGEKSMIRVQGCYLSDSEISNIVDYIGMNSDTDYDNRINEMMDSSDEPDADAVTDSGEESENDERLQEAVEMVLTDGQASISMLQRRMKIGYARAGRLIDDMASRGIISKSAGSKPREILISYEQYLQQRDTLLR